MAPILVGTAATGTAAATTGLIGAGGALTAGGLATAGALGIGISAAVKGGSGVKMPDVQLPEPKRTAEPTIQLSEQAKRNRRLAASALTRDWAEPTLGTPGLLGR